MSTSEYPIADRWKLNMRVCRSTARQTYKVNLSHQDVQISKLQHEVKELRAAVTQLQSKLKAVQSE